MSRPWLRARLRLCSNRTFSLARPVIFPVFMMVCRLKDSISSPLALISRQKPSSCYPPMNVHRSIVRCNSRTVAYIFLGVISCISKTFRCMRIQKMFMNFHRRRCRQQHQFWIWIEKCHLGWGHSSGNIVEVSAPLQKWCRWVLS